MRGAEFSSWFCAELSLFSTQFAEDCELSNPQVIAIFSDGSNSGKVDQAVVHDDRNRSGSLPDQLTIEIGVHRRGRHQDIAVAGRAGAFQLRE